jgi:hypothetical protein
MEIDPEEGRLILGDERFGGDEVKDRFVIIEDPVDDEIDENFEIDDFMD